MNNTTEINIKLLLVGDIGVGKTSLILRFSDNTFSDAPLVTLGLDFKSRTLTINKNKIHIKVYDTAGQEKYNTITASYYRGAHGVVVAFDITNPSSFKNIEVWLEQLEIYAKPNIPKILVGTKGDLERNVDKDEILAFCDKHDLDYVETSSKENINVDGLFEKFALMVSESLASSVKAVVGSSAVGSGGGGGSSGNLNSFRADSSPPLQLSAAKSNNNNSNAKEKKCNC